MNFVVLHARFSGMKQTKNVYIILAIFVLVSLVVAGGAFYMRKEAEKIPVFPVNKVPLETVYAEAAKNANFVQVSLETVDRFQEGLAVGGGKIRYSDGKNIFGYSGGKMGAVVAVVFTDVNSSEYKTCAEILKYPIPMGRELFIAGDGLSQTAPPNATSGAARVEFKTIRECGLISSFKQR